MFHFLISNKICWSKKIFKYIQILYINLLMNCDLWINMNIIYLTILYKYKHYSYILISHVNLLDSRLHELVDKLLKPNKSNLQHRSSLYLPIRCTAPSTFWFWHSPRNGYILTRQKSTMLIEKRHLDCKTHLDHKHVRWRS